MSGEPTNYLPLSQDRSHKLEDVKIDLSLQSIDKSNLHTSFIWRGFEHFWLRTFMGAKIPHRIQSISNFISNERHNLKSKEYQARITLGQRNVVDGNFMKPRTFFEIATSEAISFQRGVVRVQWVDNLKYTEYPSAASKFRILVPVPENTILSRDKSPNQSVLISGFNLRSMKQPQGDVSKVPHGFWPYRMYFSIPAIVYREGACYLQVELDLFRAWTPRKGGLPYLDIKPLAKSLKYDFHLYFTLVAANQNISISGTKIQMVGAAREVNPKRKVIEFNDTGHQDHHHLVGFSGFGFELFPLTHQKNRGYRGRYIGGLAFRVTNTESADEENIIETISQLWVPKTVIDTGVKYFNNIKVIHLDQASATLTKERVVEACICINSDENAKFFSKWNKCNQKMDCSNKWQESITVREQVSI